MTSATWFNARMWRMRAAETRALAEDMKEIQPKSIMLRIADDYDRLRKTPTHIFQGLKPTAKLLTGNEARWIAVNNPEG